MAYYNESDEVKSEDSLNDLNLFAKVCEDIRGIFDQITQLKSKKPDKWKETVQELQLEGSFHFLTLKKLNRLAQIRCKLLKDSTLDAKQKLDGNNLRLQNLQYEISHLDREVNNCLQFKSRHEDIDLVCEEEFYLLAPSNISKEEKTQNDEHLKTLARLDWELENRKTLKDDLKRTHKVKEDVTEAIKKKKQDLDSLRPNLENVLKSTLQLQEAFGDHITATRLLHESAQLLPRPLYVLFFQAKAYAEACDKNMEVLIEGNKAAAQELRDFEEKFVDATDKYAEHRQDDSDSENEERDEQESERGRRKSTTKSSPSIASNSMDSTNIMLKHPLQVCLKIYLESKAAQSHLYLRFFYFPQLEIVSVESVLDLHNTSHNIRDSPLLSVRSLLHNLRGPDDGMEVLNMVQTGSSSRKDFVLNSNEYAYLWAQRLAGIVFLQEKAKDMEISFTNMQIVIKLLRRRVLSRLALSSQLEKFSNNIVSCDDSVKEKFAPSVHFELKSWRKIEFAAYSKLPYTSTVRTLGLCSENDHFFAGTLQRGSSGNVEIAVVISDQYPKQHPIFSLLMCWRGKHTAENNLNVREMEVEVNCRLPESVCHKKQLTNQILSAQMYRLLTLLDVYVETECMMTGNDLPAEFATNKLCPRVSKGPARLKPFSYDARHKFQCYFR